MEISPLLPMYKLHFLMPSDAPQEEVVGAEVAVEEEEEAQHPLQDCLRQRKDSMSLHHKGM